MRDHDSARIVAIVEASFREQNKADARYRTELENAKVASSGGAVAGASSRPNTAGLRAGAVAATGSNSCSDWLRYTKMGRPRPFF